MLYADMSPVIGGLHGSALRVSIASLESNADMSPVIGVVDGSALRVSIASLESRS